MSLNLYFSNMGAKTPICHIVHLEIGRDTLIQEDSNFHHPTITYPIQCSLALHMTLGTKLVSRIIDEKFRSVAELIIGVGGTTYGNYTTELALGM